MNTFFLSNTDLFYSIKAQGDKAAKTAKQLEQTEIFPE